MLAIGLTYSSKFLKTAAPNSYRAVPNLSLMHSRLPTFFYFWSVTSADRRYLRQI